MSGPFEGQHLSFRTQHLDAHRALSCTQQLGPFFDSGEHERDELGLLELAAARVDPDDGFFLFDAEENHVVVRGNHHLVRPSGMVENDIVTGSPLRSFITFVPHMAGIDPELTKGSRDAPRQQLVEEQPYVSSPGRTGTY